MRNKHFSRLSLVRKATVWNTLFFSSPVCLAWKGTSVNTSENHKATTLFPWIFYHRWRNWTRFKFRRQSSILENLQTSVWFNSSKSPNATIYDPLFGALCHCTTKLHTPRGTERHCFPLDLYFSVSLQTASVRLAQNHRDGLFFERYLIFYHIHKSFFLPNLHYVLMF